MFYRIVLLCYYVFSVHRFVAAITSYVACVSRHLLNDCIMIVWCIAAMIQLTNTGTF